MGSGDNDVMDSLTMPLNESFPRNSTRPGCCGVGAMRSSAVVPAALRRVVPRKGLLEPMSKAPTSRTKEDGKRPKYCF